MHRSQRTQAVEVQLHHLRHHFVPEVPVVVIRQAFGRTLEENVHGGRAAHFDSLSRRAERAAGKLEPADREVELINLDRGLRPVTGSPEEDTGRLTILVVQLDILQVFVEVARGRRFVRNYTAHMLGLEGEVGQLPNLYLEVDVEEAVRGAGGGERGQVQ